MKVFSPGLSDVGAGLLRRLHMGSGHGLKAFLKRVRLMVEILSITQKKE